jgi:DNA-binding transcriptional LysR family regulator
VRCLQPQRIAIIEEFLLIRYATDWLVGRELADGQLVRILPEYGVPEEGAIYIVHPSSRHAPNKTRAFTDWISEGFSRDLSWRR